MEQMRFYGTNLGTAERICLLDRGIYKIESLRSRSKKWALTNFLGISSDNKHRLDYALDTNDQNLLVCSSLSTQQVEWSRTCSHAAIGNRCIYSLGENTLSEISFHGQVVKKYPLSSQFYWVHIDPSGSYLLGLNREPDKHSPNYERSIYLFSIRNQIMYKTSFTLDLGHNGTPSVFCTSDHNVLILTDENVEKTAHLSTLQEAPKKVVTKATFSITDYMTHQGTDYYLYSDITYKNSKIGIRSPRSTSIVWKHLPVEGNCEFPYIQTRMTLSSIPVLVSTASSIRLLKIRL